MAIGADRRLLSVNHRATQLLGVPAAELVGQPVLELFAETPAGRARAEEALRAGFAGEEISGRELEMRRRDGRPLWVSVWMRPLRGPDGRISAVHSIWVDITDRVLAEAERARLQQQNLYLQEELKSVHNFEEIVGRSPALLAVLDKVSRVAPTDATVLITGETGTGKELIARAIHSNSRRAGQAADQGQLRRPARGTRRERAVRPRERAPSPAPSPGASAASSWPTAAPSSSTRSASCPWRPRPSCSASSRSASSSASAAATAIKVDVRIIAATNRDLLKAVREKTFREDLYYRLSVFPIPLPPLRERAEDIPLLVRFLVDRFAARIGKRIEGVSRETMRRLAAYRWPGNIRELENVLERAVILAAGPILDFEIDGERPPALAATEDTPPSSLEDVERRHILAVLGRPTGSSKGRAAPPGSSASIPTPSAAGSRSSASRAPPTNPRSGPRHFVTPAGAASRDIRRPESSSQVLDCRAYDQSSADHRLGTAVHSAGRRGCRADHSRRAGHAEDRTS